MCTINYRALKSNTLIQYLLTVRMCTSNYRAIKSNTSLIQYLLTVRMGTSNYRAIKSNTSLIQYLLTVRMCTSNYRALKSNTFSDPSSNALICASKMFFVNLRYIINKVIFLKLFKYHEFL